MLISKELKHLKKLASQLTEEDSLIRMVLATSPVQIWAFDGDDFLYFSDEWYRYTGIKYRVENLPLCCFMDVIHREDRAIVELTMKKIFADKIRIDTNIRLRRYDGEYKTFKSYAIPYFIDGVF